MVRCPAVVSLVPYARPCTSILEVSLDGSMLDSNCVITKDVKIRSYCCYVRYATLICTSRGKRLGPKTGAVRTSRQKSCNQSVSFMLCSMARIYELWNESLNNLKVRGLVWLYSGWLSVSSSSTATPNRLYPIWLYFLLNLQI